MKITGLFKDLFKSDNDGFIDYIISKKSEQLHIKELAIEHAIDLIAKTIAKSEIQIYKYDKKDKKIKKKIDNNYYTLNVRPNSNQTGTSFFYNVVSTLLHDEEALIIEINNKLYLADDWDENDSILESKIYKNIKISDSKNNQIDLQEKSFTSDEVIHLKLENTKINQVLEDFYNDYGKLLLTSYDYYKQSNIRKWKLKVPGSQPTMIDPQTKQVISYEDYKKKVTEGLFSEEEGIVMLSEAFDLTSLGDNKQVNSSDYRELIKGWKDDVAMMFNIPLDIFYGSKTDKSTGTNDFITFAVSPILEIIEDGLNATIISKENYLKGERIRINKLNMKHFDIFDSANSLDKLFGDGFSHNDLREFLDIPTIDEEWANEHHITKNYGNSQEFSKGGDIDE